MCKINNATVSSVQNIDQIENASVIETKQTPSRLTSGSGININSNKNTACDAIHIADYSAVKNDVGNLSAGSSQPQKPSSQERKGKESQSKSVSENIQPETESAPKTKPQQPAAPLVGANDKQENPSGTLANAGEKQEEQGAQPKNAQESALASVLFDSPVENKSTIHGSENEEKSARTSQQSVAAQGTVQQKGPEGAGQEIGNAQKSLEKIFNKYKSHKNVPEKESSSEKIALAFEAVDLTGKVADIAGDASLAKSCDAFSNVVDLVENFKGMREGAQKIRDANKLDPEKQKKLLQKTIDSLNSKIDQATRSGKEDGNVLKMRLDLKTATSQLGKITNSTTHDLDVALAAYMRRKGTEGFVDALVGEVSTTEGIASTKKTLASAATKIASSVVAIGNAAYSFVRGAWGLLRRATTRSRARDLCKNGLAKLNIDEASVKNGQELKDCLVCVAKNQAVKSKTVDVLFSAGKVALAALGVAAVASGAVAIAGVAVAGAAFAHSLGKYFMGKNKAKQVAAWQNAATEPNRPKEEAMSMLRQKDPEFAVRTLVARLVDERSTASGPPSDAAPPATWRALHHLGVPTSALTAIAGNGNADPDKAANLLASYLRLPEIAKEA